MVRMVRLIEDVLVRAVNPPRDALEADASWLRAHPVLGGLAAFAAVSGIGPAAACALAGALLGWW